MTTEKLTLKKRQKRGNRCCQNQILIPYGQHFEMQDTAVCSPMWTSVSVFLLVIWARLCSHKPDKQK